jgi:hypothetical protein
MQTERDVTRVVRSWLRTDGHESADRVLDNVLDLLDTTPQRRSIWPARRFHDMNTPLRVAVSVAAVVAIAVVGISLWPGRGPNGGAVATPSPTPTAVTSPAPSPTAMAFHDGVLVPGTYVSRPYSPRSQVRFTFTVPAGWEASGDVRVFPTDVGPGAPDGMAFAILGVGDLYSDPCNGTAGDLPTGTSVDGLVNALVAQTAYGVSTPTAISLGGFSGKRLDLQLPSDVDFSTCKNGGGDPAAPRAGIGGYFVWESATPGAPNIYAQGPGNRFHLWILDVDGARAVVMTHDYAGTSAANRAALQGIVDSVQVQP